MVKTLKNWKIATAIILTTTTLFVACQKDDDTSPPLQVDQTTEAIKTTTRKVSADNIPDIMQYIATKSNSRGQFSIIKQNNDTRSSEPDLVIGELQTQEILKVTDQYDRSNYTFLLTSIESTNTSVRSTFNLVVKESSSGLFSYIMEYRPDENWSPDYTDRNFMTTFTGEIIFYTTDGVYIAKSDLTEGESSSVQTRTNCDDTGDSTGNGGGSEGTSDSSDSSTTSTTSDGDGGNGGHGITVETTVVVCGCDPSHEGGSDSDDCSCEAEDTTVVNIKSAESTKIDNLSRNPCVEDSPEFCHYPNNDPCPCNAEGTGCLEIDTNDTVGFIDIPCALANNEINNNSPFNVDFSSINPCTPDSENITTPEDEKLLCIYNKITDSPLFKQFFIDTFGESEILNVTFKVVDQFPNNSHPNANGLTVSNAVEQNTQTGEIVSMNADILIRRSYMESKSTIAVAKTVIHEAIHAYLLVHFLGCDQAVEIEDLNQLDFGELLNQYYGTACPNQEQHEFMFEHMLPAMQQILADIRDNFVPASHQAAAEGQDHFIDENNPSGDTVSWDWNQFYFYLSLNGLHQTNGFLNNIQNTPSKLTNFNLYSNIGLNSFSKTHCED